MLQPIPFPMVLGRPEYMPDAAIYSFSYGSGAGPKSLQPQQLKYCISITFL